MSAISSLAKTAAAWMRELALLGAVGLGAIVGGFALALLCMAADPAAKMFGASPKGGWAARTLYAPTVDCSSFKAIAGLRVACRSEADGWMWVWDQDASLALAFDRSESGSMEAVASLAPELADRGAWSEAVEGSSLAAAAELAGFAQASPASRRWGARAPKAADKFGKKQSLSSIGSMVLAGWAYAAIALGWLAAAAMSLSPLAWFAYRQWGIKAWSLGSLLFCSRAIGASLVVSAAGMAAHAIAIVSSADIPLSFGGYEASPYYAVYWARVPYCFAAKERKGLACRDEAGVPIAIASWSKAVDDAPESKAAAFERAQSDLGFESQSGLAWEKVRSGEAGRSAFEIAGALPPSESSRLWATRGESWNEHGGVVANISIGASHVASGLIWLAVASVGIVGGLCMPLLLAWRRAAVLFGAASLMGGVKKWWRQRGA